MTTQYNVGQTVTWASKIGPVAAEYRGKVMGMDGWEACIIVRQSDGSFDYQTMVPLAELTAAE